MSAKKSFNSHRPARSDFAGDVTTASALFQELSRQIRRGRRLDPVSLNRWLPRFFKATYAALSAKTRVDRVDFMVGSVVPGRINAIERQRAIELMKEIGFGNPSVQRSFVPDILVRALITDPSLAEIPIANSIAGVLCVMTSPQFKPRYIKPLDFAAIGSGRGHHRRIDGMISLKARP